tara:strand:+ start:23517 stop:25247 length:1731 start_codon:yes stop_codon:yes gene_type:complete
MVEQVILKIIADSAAASKDINKVTEDTKGAKKETTLLGLAFDKVKAAMVKVGQVSKVMFGSIKAGLISTGLGAFIILVGSLVQYFKDSEEGASKLKQIMSQVGVVVGNITDIFSNLGKAVYNLMSGNFDEFKEGIKEATSQVKNFGEQTRKEMKDANQLEKDRLALQKFEREANVDKAKTEAEIMKLRLKARDIEEFTAKERLEFMRQANQLADEQLAKDLHVAEEKLRFQQVENSFSKSTQENLDAEANLEAEVFRIQKANFSERKRMKSEEQALVREDAANTKAAQKVIDDAKAKADKKKADDQIKQDKRELDSANKLLALQQENTLLAIQDDKKRAIAALNIQREKELASVANMENSEKLKAEINKKYNIQIQNQDAATSEAERKLGIGDAAAAASLLGGFADLETEGTKKWKNLKIAETRINSFVAAQAAFSSMSAIPVVGQALGLIAAGLAIRQGQTQINEIKATEIPETKLNRGGVVGGYGSGTSDSVNARLSKGEVVINARSARMFRGALSRMNVAGGGVSFASGGATSAEELSGLPGLSNEPLKAYVVTDELTKSQDRLSQIRRRSSI